VSAVIGALVDFIKQHGSEALFLLSNNVQQNYRRKINTDDRRWDA